MNNNNKNTLEEDIIASQIVCNLFKMFPDKKDESNKKKLTSSRLDDIYNKYGTIQKNLIKQDSFYSPNPPNSDTSTEFNKLLENRNIRYYTRYQSKRIKI